MQFKVPQFIDVEDKLFGPFTFRQFAYLAGGAGVIFIIYKLMGFFLGIIFIIPIAILTFLLVFYKVNNRPFVYYLEASFMYLVSSKLYLWKQRIIKPENKRPEKDKDDTLNSLVSLAPMSTSNKIKDIAWSLDIKDTEE